MGVDDYVDREAGVIAAATAAAVSPRARELFRRGAVYGLAGVLKAGDVTVAAARGAMRGARNGASEAAGRPAAPTARTSARTRRTGTAQARSRRRKPSSTGSK